MTFDIDILFCIQILVGLFLAGVLMPLWMISVTKFENKARLISHNSNQELSNRIKRTGALFSHINVSSIKLARLLSSSLDEKDLHFSKIKSKVKVLLLSPKGIS